MSHTSHLNFIFIRRENYFTKEFFLISGIFRLNCLLEFNILHCGRLIMWKQEKVKSCYSLELLLSLNTTSRTINTVVMWLLAYKHLVRGLTRCDMLCLTVDVCRCEVPTSANWLIQLMLEARRRRGDLTPPSVTSEDIQTYRGRARISENDVPPTSTNRTIIANNNRCFTGFFILHPDINLTDTKTYNHIMSLNTEHWTDHDSVV